MVTRSKLHREQNRREKTAAKQTRKQAAKKKKPAEPQDYVSSLGFLIRKPFIK